MKDKEKLFVVLIILSLSLLRNTLQTVPGRLAAGASRLALANAPPTQPIFRFDRGQTNPNLAQPIPVPSRAQSPRVLLTSKTHPPVLLDPGEDPGVLVDDDDTSVDGESGDETESEDEDEDEGNEKTQATLEDEADGEGLGIDEEQCSELEKDDERDPAAPRVDEPVHAEVGPQPRPQKRSPPTLAPWILTMFTILSAQAKNRIDGLPALYAKQQTFWFPKIATFFLLRMGKQLPQDLYDVRWFLWDPLCLVPIPCPHCRKTLVRHGQISRPRRCVDFQGLFFIIGFRYRCPNCKHPSSGLPNVTFHSWDSRILAMLPPELALEFPARLTSRSGISVGLSTWMRSCFQNGMGAKQFSDCVRVQHLEHYDKTRLQYYHSLVPRVKMGQWRGEDRFEVFLPYDDTSDCGMHGFVPNATFFRKVHDQILLEHRGEMLQHVSMLPLTVGAMDHSFKVSRFFVEIVIMC